MSDSRELIPSSSDYVAGEVHDIVERPSRTRERALLAFSSFLFFLSGASALIYQVVWQRMLSLFSGADVYSITLIVAAFMAGLGCGSLAGGSLADRLSVRGRMMGFAIAEAAVGAFALLSKYVYYDLLYVKFSPLGRSPLALTAVLFASLLWPTFWMGTSLPLLAKALTRSLETAAGRVGALYGVNILGAACGALTTTWFLMRAFSMDVTLRWSALINFFCAAGALVLATCLRESRPHEASSASSHGTAETGLASFRGWMLVYGVSGFIALSLEILWFRLLGVMMKASAFTFGTLLGIYLSGLALGTLLGRALAERSRRPGRAFFLMQGAIVLYAALSLTLFITRLNAFSFTELRTYFGGYEPFDMRLPLRAITGALLQTGSRAPELQPAASQFFLLYVVLPLVFVGPPTFLMGLSFPFLQKTVQRDLQLLGRRVGLLQAANIAGSMTGAMATGWLFLRVWGTAGTLRLLVALSGFFLFLWVYERAKARALRARWGYGLVAATLVITVAVIPSSSELWATLHGTTPEHFIFAEDATGLTVIKPDDPPTRPGRRPRSSVYVSGIGQSWFPYGGIHSLLGFLPVMLHPHPYRIAIIGLGSGDTLFSAGGREETVEIASIEIVRSQVDALRAQGRERPYPAIDALLADRRIRWVFTDGRSFIQRERKPYDLIEADALRPVSAYAGNLYSLEYFSLLKSHLAPGGYAVTWAPTDRVVATFLKAFPEVVVFTFQHVSIAVGSTRPIDMNPTLMRARLQTPFARRYYEPSGVSLEAMETRLTGLSYQVYSRDYDRSRLTDVDTDLFPKDEFLAFVR